MPAPMITALALAGVSVMPPLPAPLFESPPGSFPHHRPAGTRSRPVAFFPLPHRPGTDTAPPPGLLAAGPTSRRARRCRFLLDRDLLVDQAEVDALPPADEAGGYVHQDRQDVHGAHVVQRVAVVHPVAGVREPLVEV